MPSPLAKDELAKLRKKYGTNGSSDCEETFCPENVKIKATVSGKKGHW